MLTIIGDTDPGRREHNEDSFVADSSIGFGLVADGMGGYACGEVASDLVQQTVHDAVSRDEDLSDAIRSAHDVVIEAANADPSKKGMGSTVVAVKFSGSDYKIGWVGDSRAYLWDQLTGVLKRVTRDHSYVEALLSSGAISQQEALNHPHKHLITQAMGVAGEEGLIVDVVTGRMMTGQKLILCSDGLVDEVEDHEIAHILATIDTPAETVDKLIQTAVESGGRDNITVVMAFNDEDQGTLENEIPNLMEGDELSDKIKDNNSASLDNQGIEDNNPKVELSWLEVISIQVTGYFNKIVKSLRK